jgi:NhaP-type Na+/H+ or K+/H+ antiporter
MPTDLAPLLAAAAEGFSFGHAYALALLFLGVALFAAIGALSHQRERAFSASLIYLGIGLVAAALLAASRIEWLEPVENASLLEHATEFALIVALFATGLRLDRELKPRAWGAVARLLGVAMLVTIAAVALFGWGIMGLSIGAAVMLGAALAPTDPVLAGDIGVGPPGEEEEREPNFSVTAEAGFNDGLAFPFLLLGFFLATRDGAGWVWQWFAADLLYAVTAGILIGALAGYGLAWALVPLRERNLLIRGLDGWLGVAAVLVVYGATEVAGAYGFLAAFVAGVAFRRYERDHEMNRAVHGGTEVVEKFCELAVILLLGSLVTVNGLGVPGLWGWLLVPVLLLVVRPLAVLAAFIRSPLTLRERAFLAWFGVRGVGSLYYVSAAIAAGVLSGAESETVFWTVAAVVLVSIVAHGVTGAPVTRRLLVEELAPVAAERGERR